MSSGRDKQTTINQQYTLYWALYRDIKNVLVEHGGRIEFPQT